MSRRLSEEASLRYFAAQVDYACWVRDHVKMDELFKEMKRRGLRVTEGSVRIHPSGSCVDLPGGVEDVRDDTKGWRAS